MFIMISSEEEEIPCFDQGGCLDTHIHSAPSFPGLPGQVLFVKSTFCEQVFFENLIFGQIVFSHNFILQKKN